jgi:hypothetical protein
MAERRCAHSFLLSRVKCPKGCVRGPNGKPVRRRQPVKLERERRAPKPANPRTLESVPRSTVWAALADAPTLDDALNDLETTARALRQRIENDGELYGLFVKLSSNARSERDGA